MVRILLGKNSYPAAGLQDRHFQQKIFTEVPNLIPVATIPSSKSLKSQEAPKFNWHFVPRKAYNQLTIFVFFSWNAKFVWCLKLFINAWKWQLLWREKNMIAALKILQLSLRESLLRPWTFALKGNGSAVEGGTGGMKNWCKTFPEVRDTSRFQCCVFSCPRAALWAALALTPYTHWHLRETI